ncbi:serine/threonine protein kinase [Salinibaculum rarum]|uniref:serine/threonine protein kinase n=1 Tax=Salinibaculum rarum TaxID=3058903 RepID=UPI00265FFEF2|nr:protein kinase [Salinibaculum sp. KK48]
MASSDPDELDDPFSVLVSVLQEPEQMRSQLPRIVSLFEDDDRRVRLSAAWACTAIANELEDEDTIAYLIRRLSDRLDEEHVSLELTTTLDYLSTRYSKQVEQVLSQLHEEERERGSIPLPQVGNFTRSSYYSTEPSRDGMGRTKIAGSDTDDDPRSAYTNSQREDTDQTRRVSEDDTEETEDGRERDEQSTDDSEEGGGPSTDDDQEEAFGAMGEQRTAITGIATASRFDKLHLLASRRRQRYADVYDALVGRGSEEEAVALRLFHDPPDASDRVEFVARMRTQLTRWEAVSDHPHVVTVLDWGIDPKPWLATRFAGEPLAESESIPAGRVFDDAIGLAAAVSHLHASGVVHGGIDPGNVAYPDDVMGSDTQQQPLLDNVGLMNAFRYHFEPALHLDPRYAAPEYFDSQYGGIDHRTDIYQLGAVLYYLFTGQPPYTGEFEQVREGVLTEEPTAPSTIREDVPATVDEIIKKSMARDKLTRYETVEHLEQDLVGIRRRGEDG